MLRSFFWRSFKIIQRIVHPAKIPFIIESQSIVFYRSRHFQKRCRIFCNEHRSRMQFLQSCIHIFHKCKRTRIHAPIRLSLPVNRTADCIHSYSVKMILFQPVICGRLQKAADFPSGIIKISCSPLTVCHITLHILIQLCSIIFCQSIIIRRKMNRNKIHNHADSRLMTFIHQLHQISCSSIT